MAGELATLVGRTQAPAELTTDFKAQVLRVLAMLAPPHDATSVVTRAATPGQSALARADAPVAPAVFGDTPNAGGAPELAAKLKGLLEGALHRVQSQQLATLAARDHGAPAWHFELPVRLGQQYDAVRLTVGREPPRQGHDEDVTWTVNLALSPGDLGGMHVRVTLSGIRISSTLWAEHPETAELVRGRLDELRTGLDGAGFDVGRMQCLDGCPPAARAEPSGGLLRVRA